MKVYRQWNTNGFVRDAAHRCCFVARCVCVLCALCQPCRECQSMRAGHVVQCVRRRVVGVCGAVTRPRAQCAATLLSARARSKGKQHRATASTAAHNVQGAVNDVEFAPCQPSAAYGHMT